MHLLYDGPMRGVGFRPRIAVQPQPILCGSDGVGETKRSALSPGRINIARACWDRTGYVLLARALMGLSRQLPILQLRPMHGHRERYRFLLRDKSPVLAPAARRLSGPILGHSLPRRSTCILLIHCGITATGPPPADHLRRPLQRQPRRLRPQHLRLLLGPTLRLSQEQRTSPMR